MINSSTIKHLRIPFSFHLMPVFLFALSQASFINWNKTFFAFVLLHLIVYPASNGYNSYQDKDEDSIGGLKNPPAVTKNLFKVTLLFDIIAVCLSYFISIEFLYCLSVYILASRAYSYRKLRLKQYAFIGFLTVFVFQGGFTFLMSSVAISDLTIESFISFPLLLCMTMSSLFIGSVYPLTQIYQHFSDKKDGVITLSYKLGYTGTFVFSAVLFAFASLLLFYYFDTIHQRISVLLFFILMLPVILRLFFWFGNVRKNSTNANYENTMKMNWLASSCMNVYFALLILNNFYFWF